MVNYLGANFHTKWSTSFTMEPGATSVSKRWVRYICEFDILSMHVTGYLNQQQSWKKIVGSLDATYSNYPSACNWEDIWGQCIVLKKPPTYVIPHLSYPSLPQSMMGDLAPPRQHDLDQHCIAEKSGDLFNKIGQSVPTFFSMIESVPWLTKNFDGIIRDHNRVSKSQTDLVSYLFSSLIGRLIWKKDLILEFLLYPALCGPNVSHVWVTCEPWFRDESGCPFPRGPKRCQPSLFHRKVPYLLKHFCPFDTQLWQPLISGQVCAIEVACNFEILPYFLFECFLFSGCNVGISTSFQCIAPLYNHMGKADLFIFWGWGPQCKGINLIMFRDRSVTFSAKSEIKWRCVFE